MQDAVFECAAKFRYFEDISSFDCKPGPRTESKGKMFLAMIRNEKLGSAPLFVGFWSVLCCIGTLGSFTLILLHILKWV